MQDMINSFKQYNIQLNKSEKTINGYTSEIDIFLREFNINSPEDLKQLENKEFVKLWLEVMNKKDYSVSTINKKKNILSVFSNFLILEDIIKENKFKQLSAVKNDNTKIDIYSDEDVNNIFKYMEDKIEQNNFQRNIDKNVFITNLTAIKLMSSCALRVEELCSIQINDIDLSTGKIWIRGKGFKGNISRFNKMNKEMIKLVTEYLKIRNNINIKEGAEEYFFISPISKNKITDNSIRNFIKKINKELEIITGSPCHSFRHNKASDLISKGAEVKAVSLFLGHSSERTTEKYYIKGTEKIMEDLAEL